MANMEMDIDRITDKATMILETIKAHFLANGISLPERRYLAVGDLGSTAHDKEQVTVGFSVMSEGLPFNSVPVMNACLTPDHGIFYAEIVRCTPQPTNSGGLKASYPAPEEMSEYATLRMRDAWLLKRVAEDLSANISFTFTKKVVYGVSVPPESGGLQAVVLTLNTAV